MSGQLGQLAVEQRLQRVVHLPAERQTGRKELRHAVRLVLHDCKRAEVTKKTGR